ncbi:hypothetical protein CK203_101793 [Vitis vinifera]|uniref:Uncharacterized protein n=1 Tax=Vitis vinifera TaxID=29760 RepID=A0A438FFV1_VITVI|nr:hypothetical protein CK203_101793 [Vitis vinifera]
MNFMSYVAEVSRGWDEPNARDMGRMKSQPNAKGEMYILNDNIDKKAKIAAIARRLEELEMKKMQEVQAISQTPLLPMRCSICRSYEHLWMSVLPFQPRGKCLYKQHVQALPQASSLEQAMVNLSKFVGDFVGAQKSINAQLSQRIDSVESSLIKRMDEVQNDLSQKIDNLQDQSQEDSHQEELMKKHMPPPFLQALYGKIIQTKFWMIKSRRNCKEIERKSFGAKTEQKQGKNRGLRDFAASAKSALCCETISQLRNQVWHMSATSQHRSPHSKLRNGCEAPKHEKLPISQPKLHSTGSFAVAKPNFGTRVPFRSIVTLFRSYKTAAKCQSVKTPNFAAKAPFRREFLNCEATFWHTSAISQHSDPHFAAAKHEKLPISQPKPHFAGCFVATKWQRSIKTPNFAAKAPFRRGKLLKCQQSPVTMHLKRKPRTPWDHTHQASHSISDLLKPSEPIFPAEETMPAKETT